MFDQKEKLVFAAKVEELESLESSILETLTRIESILRETPSFTKEYYLASSHYIPQIITALKNNTKYLPRGEYTLEDTINSLKDSFDSENEKQTKGVKKYIF